MKFLFFFIVFEMKKDGSFIRKFLINEIFIKQSQIHTTMALPF